MWLCCQVHQLRFSELHDLNAAGWDALKATTGLEEMSSGQPPCG